MLFLLIERPGFAPIERTVDSDEAIVGRSEKADIVLDDSSVSRRHARFFRQQDAWFIEDLRSRNGTELNGRPLARAERVGGDDVVRVGSANLRVVARHGDAPLRDATLSGGADQDAVYSVLRPASELMRRTADATASSRLAVLNEVHRALASPIARVDLLQMVLDRAFAVLKPEDAAIFLRGADGELYQAAERRSPSATGPLLVSRRLAEEVTVKGAAALVLDAQADERFAAARSVLVSGVRSILAAPLSDAEGCLGMIALYSRLGVRRFSEDDLELLVSLASAAALRIRNIDLVEKAAEQRALERELALARDIQMAMLRQAPAREEIEVAARLVPARSVGGDFYDFLVAGGRLWFIVADVSGKGIAAALMMAVAQTLFRAIAPSGASLAELMSRLNQELARDNDRAMFVTALAGCLDLATGQLQLGNAGHNLPYRLDPAGGAQTLKVTNALALGVIDDVTFPVTELTMEPGDGLLAYTDGVCDAVDPRHRSFGTSGIDMQLVKLAARSPEDIVNGIFKAIDAFAGRAPQEDDITVAVLRYRGCKQDGAA